jgi:uncharacterized protein (UPF0147 family)
MQTPPHPLKTQIPDSSSPAPGNPITQSPDGLFKVNTQKREPLQQFLEHSISLSPTHNQDQILPNPSEKSAQRVSIWAKIEIWFIW